MFKEIIKGIYRDKFARIAFLVLAFIYFCLFFADIIAPYTKDYTDRQLSYVPPSPVLRLMKKANSLVHTHTITSENMMQN